MLRKAKGILLGLIEKKYAAVTRSVLLIEKGYL
jgi:hypothetical protein